MTRYRIYISSQVQQRICSFNFKSVLTISDVYPMSIQCFVMLPCATSVVKNINTLYRIFCISNTILKSLSTVLFEIKHYFPRPDESSLICNSGSFLNLKCDNEVRKADAQAGHRDSTSQNAKSAKKLKRGTLRIRISALACAKLLPLFCALKDFYETRNM